MPLPNLSFSRQLSTTLLRAGKMASTRLDGARIKFGPFEVTNQVFLKTPHFLLYFNVALQDGPEAGQTVPHVHVHVIPRTPDDLPRNDDVYKGMSGEEGNVGGAMWDEMRRPVPGGAMPQIEDEDRKARSEAEMGEEAQRYKAALRELGVE
ncbi:hypothetical protein V2G26_006736 [Clonostachys chloroleuca]